MCLFKVKCVKVTLFFVSFLLLAGCVVSIVFGTIAKENAIYGIVGSVIEVDLQMIIFLFCVIIGVILVFVMACAMCTSVKRICFFHYLFAILLTIITLFFIVLGIVLMIIGIGLSDQLEELCSSNNSDSDFQQAMNELYSRSDSFYCTVQCPCYIGSTFYYTGKTVATLNPSDNTNVQDCKAYIEAAYADYNIDFSDLEEIIEYLDYFGEIEKEYKCSGICTLQKVYYFGDSSRGEPPKACKDPINDELLKGEILGMGIGYLVIGVVLFVVLFVQYGLCCREDPDKRSKREGHYDESRYETEKPYKTSRADNYNVPNTMINAPPQQSTYRNPYI
ncbi:unnamed protein product [Moneuplotes crassus]|uniref:Tetraspanin family protein n=1 Tax=Euplotes crassus TaxID=5936 RepID=A0AAD1X9E9_EUPCR|nr:unnamed protein product [Moneuplotes crassus]